MNTIMTIINNIIALTQDNRLLVLSVILALYIVKGFIMIIPIQALYLAAGAVFGVYAAIAVNVIGIVMCTSVTYKAGSRMGADKLNEYCDKHPKLKLLSDFEKGNAFLFTLVVRSVGFVPCDAVSLYCGLKGIGYGQYILGTVLGMMPGLVLTVIMGANIRTPGSPRFIISACFRVLIFILSCAIYSKLKKERNIKDI